MDHLPEPSLPAVATPPPTVHAALLESRQRWRDFVGLCADIAFETDAKGRFTFLSPDPVIGWPSTLLLGQPAGSRCP